MSDDYSLGLNSDLHPLGEFLEIIKERREGPLPIYSVTLRDGMQRRDGLGRIIQSDLNNEDNLFAAKNDICYNMMRMWQGASGIAPEDCLVSPAYVVCRPNEDLHPSFAAHLLKSEQAKKSFVDRSQGVTSDRWRLYPEEFLKIRLPIPPLREQKKIAEILSGIDKRIHLANKRITQLDILLRSLGEKYFGPETQCEVKRIGEIFEICSGTTPSRSRRDYFCRNGGTPWIKTMDLNDDHVRTTDEQLTFAAIREGRARRFPRGTLLVAMYGGWNQIGRTGILAQESSCNQAMSALLPAEGILPDFLNLQLVIRRSYWRSVAASSRKDPNIAKSDVSEMPIFVPPFYEQTEIARTLGSVIKSSRKEADYLESLLMLKQSLASDLLSGRKRVSV
jgi:type I restriction enzyme S subunit